MNTRRSAGGVRLSRQRRRGEALVHLLERRLASRSGRTSRCPSPRPACRRFVGPFVDQRRQEQRPYPALLSNASPLAPRRPALRWVLPCEARGAIDIKKVRAQLLEAVGEWRSTLAKAPAEVQPALRRLIPERLEFTPREDEQGRYYEFNGVGTIEPVISGVVRVAHKVASPAGTATEPISRISPLAPEEWRHSRDGGGGARFTDAGDRGKRRGNEHVGPGLLRSFSVLFATAPRSLHQARTVTVSDVR